jgi:hypothetical protein
MVLSPSTKGNMAGLPVLDQVDTKQTHTYVDLQAARSVQHSMTFLGSLEARVQDCESRRNSKHDKGGTLYCTMRLNLDLARMRGRLGNIKTSRPRAQQMVQGGSS